MRLTASAVMCVLLVACCTLAGGGTADNWVSLGGENHFSAWKASGQWLVAGDARIAPDNDRRLVPVESSGSAVMINGPTGKTQNLVSKQEFGDVEFHCEFLVPNKSNSGVKFEGLYEVQIYDSWGVKTPKASDCGGIYPRAELKPNYHYLDEGYPPRTNAARKPGEWQTLDVIFQAPRFDSSGKKTAKARFVEVRLNGQLIQENVELKTPTGHAWHEPERAEGPILLQADHGPVAFRDLRVRAWKGH